ncbi:hypothetical protein HJG60_011850 [Phyllostomus discolor]|uniref:Uncharacterized protein n=1 Tax=Phyllostomus discolor TaxID=89673 RepID=A0A833ZD12_9CHIR|nr:hypothetical protein HJG60_011850 [Phyllostomus discolor]
MSAEGSGNGKRVRFFRAVSSASLPGCVAPEGSVLQPTELHRSVPGILERTPVASESGGSFCRVAGTSGRCGERMREGAQPDSRSLLGWADFGSHSCAVPQPPETGEKNHRQTCRLFKKEVWTRDLVSDSAAKDSRRSTH